jgi:glycosyltransferase involved in cell wall biosynthesis
MKTSVVIPVWITDDDKLRVAQNCIYSFKAADPDTELVLVDNASTVGGGFLRENASIYIRFPKNVGFTPAINAGIKAANGEMIALANDDIRVPTNWIDVCSQILSEPNVGTVHPRMIKYDEPFNFGDLTAIGGRERWCGGSFIITTRVFLNFMRDFERDTEQYPGLYDENYGKGGGGDDWDFVNRVRKLGKQAYTNKTAFQHLMSYSLQKMPDRQEVASQNDDYFTKKWGIKKEDLFMQQFPDQMEVKYHEGFI